MPATSAPLTRLKKRSDFLAAARSKKKWVAPGLLLQVLPRRRSEAGAPALRVGFTASKKVGGAVVRNRAKRRLRAAVDALLRGREPEQACDLVLIARSGTAQRPYPALVDDLRAGVVRFGVLARTEQKG